MTNQSFDYDRFTATRDVALFRGDMLVPMNDPSIPVPHEIIQRLVDEFATYDPPHLIYAIEICSNREPALVAPHLPSLLAHKDSSVEAAVVRALFRLPAAYVDRQLFDGVRQAVTTLPEQTRSYLLRDLIPHLEQKLEENK